ncbi:MAG: hypothetical protein U0935_23225 [Pirellulales bacterium]
MWWRFLVSTWVRQQAQQTLQSLMAEALRGEAPTTRGGATSPRQGGTAAAPASAPTDEPRPPCSIAFLLALDLEAAGIVERLRDRRQVRRASYVEHDGFLRQSRVIVAETGVGQTAARQAAADLIALHRPAWVVSAGFAGGLVDSLRRGHFVMPEQVVGESGDVFSVGLKIPAEVLAAQKTLHTGRLVTVDRLIRQTAQRQELAVRYEAVACDMETWSVAAECARQRTRFLSVRIVTDALDDVLPAEIENLLEQKSLAGKIGAVTGALLNRPSSVKDLWQLYEEAQRSSTRLGQFLTGVAAQLSGV